MAWLVLKTSHNLSQSPVPGDVNGATDIYKIAYNTVNNKEIPNYLSRNMNNSICLDEPVKPNFTCFEIGKPWLIFNFTDIV